MRRVAWIVALGLGALPAVGAAQDRPLEAEGGARLLVGPSVHVAPPHKRWQLSFAGGPTFHATNSGRTSDALRGLPWFVASWNPAQNSANA